MFEGLVGLIAMSSSLSPLSSSVTLTGLATLTACAAETPITSASAATTAIEILRFTRRSPFGPQMSPSVTRSGAFGDPFGRLAELVPGAELDSRAAELLAGGALELVDRHPPAVDDGAHPPLGQQRL